MPDYRAFEFFFRKKSHGGWRDFPGSVPRGVRAVDGRGSGRSEQRAPDAPARLEARWWRFREPEHYRTRRNKEPSWPG